MKNNNLPDVLKMSSLERQIFGRNRINAYTIENIKKVLPQLSEHLNKKIELSDGSKAAKFKVELLDVPYIQKIAQSFRTYQFIHRRNTANIDRCWICSNVCKEVKS